MTACFGAAGVTTKLLLARTVMLLYCLQLDDLESLNYDDLTAVAKLTSDPHYNEVMVVSSGSSSRACATAAAIKPCNCSSSCRVWEHHGHVPASHQGRAAATVTAAVVGM